MWSYISKLSMYPKIPACLRDRMYWLKIATDCQEIALKHINQNFVVIYSQFWVVPPLWISSSYSLVICIVSLLLTLYLSLSVLPYIANHLRWKHFAVFVDWSILWNCSCKIACTIGLAIQDRHPTINVFQQITV